MSTAKPKTVIPIVAGALLIAAGIDGIALWSLLFVGGALAIGIPLVGGALAAILFICGAIAVAFGVIALVGGVMAIRRRMWGLALVGSILGLFLLGFLVGFEASLLSLVALILLIVARKEF